MTGAKANGYSYQEFAGGGFSSSYGFSYYNGFGGGVWDHMDESWGPRLDIGLLLPQFDSPLSDPNDPSTRIATPWISQPNNIKDFFELGLTWDNNFTVTSNHEKGDVRLSLSSQSVKGTIPNTEIGRAHV